jgi:hypothetical protein
MVSFCLASGLRGSADENCWLVMGSAYCRSPSLRNALRAWAKETGPPGALVADLELRRLRPSQKGDKKNLWKEVSKNKNRVPE